LLASTGGKLVWVQRLGTDPESAGDRIRKQPLMCVGLTGGPHLIATWLQIPEADVEVKVES